MQLSEMHKAEQNEGAEPWRHARRVAAAGIKALTLFTARQPRLNYGGLEGRLCSHDGCGQLCGPVELFSHCNAILGEHS